MNEVATPIGLTMLPYAERPSLKMPVREWLLPLVFMLSLSLWGLSFYPAIILVVFLLVHSLRHDRYNFIVMVTLIGGTYGFISNKAMGLMNFDIVFIISILLAVIYVKPPIVRRTMWVLVIYTAGLLILASFSLESMSIQFLTLRHYLSFIFFIVPIVSFCGHEFDIHRFFKVAFQYGFIACVFYILDSIILGNNIFVPHTFAWGREVLTFTSISFNPFSFVRKYPPGLYVLFLSIYPLARFYRLPLWQWGVIIVAVIATQTVSLLATLVLVFIICQGKFKRFLLWMAAGVGLMVILFVIDSYLPYHVKDNYRESTLRIRSTYDQFEVLFNAVDDEDVAAFASGRVSQILPKAELIYREGKEWVGLGFLHQEKTKITKYIITNEYYTDVSENNEVATGVENAAAQVWINIGWIGMALHLWFLFMLYYLLRRYRYVMYFLSIMGCGVIMGMSGWFTLISFHGLFMLALSFSVVIMANTDKDER